MLFLFSRTPGIIPAFRPTLRRSDAPTLRRSDAIKRIAFPTVVKTTGVIAFLLLSVSVANTQTGRIQFSKSRGPVRLIGCSTATQTRYLSIDQNDPSHVDGFGRLVMLPLAPNIQEAIKADCDEVRKKYGVGAPLIFVDEEGGPNAVAINYAMDNRYPDGTVLFGKKLLEKEWSEGRFGIPTTIGHEFAHIMQFKRKFPVMATQWQELHADYMAGWFIAHRSRSRRDSDPNVSAKSVYDSGDYEFNNPQHHGTKEERFAAFKEGFNLNSQNVSDAAIAYAKGLEYIQDQGAKIEKAEDAGNTGDPNIPFYRSLN